MKQTLMMKIMAPITLKITLMSLQHTCTAVGLVAVALVSSMAVMASCSPPSTLLICLTMEDHNVAVAGITVIILFLNFTLVITESAVEFCDKLNEEKKQAEEQTEKLKKKAEKERNARLEQKRRGRWLEKLGRLTRLSFTDTSRLN